MRKTMFAVLILFLLFPTAAYSQDFSSWEDLIPYIQQLEARIEVLENQNDIEVPAITDASGQTNDFGFPPGGQLMGEIILNVKDIYTTVNKDGENILLIHFEFTNKTDQTIRFERAVCKKAFQNGIELKKNSHPAYSENDRTEIRPNTTIDVIYSWIIFDIENPVELELGHYAGSCPDVPFLYYLDLSLAKAWEK